MSLSESILADYLLLCSGLSHQERLMIKTAIGTSARTFTIVASFLSKHHPNIHENGFKDKPKYHAPPNPHKSWRKRSTFRGRKPLTRQWNKHQAFQAELDDEDREEFLQELGLEEPGLNRVIRAGYNLLTLQTYFTAGVKEVRAWTYPEGSTAPQAAGKIHTDFEKGFIRAEIVGYDDYVEFNGESGAKEAGKWRLEGKDYIVKDGDVMHFLFNV